MHTVAMVRAGVEKILAGKLTSLLTDAEGAHTIEVGKSVVFRETIWPYHWQLVEGGLAVEHTETTLHYPDTTD